MHKIVSCCVLLNILAPMGAYAKDKYNYYLHNKDTIARLSHGKFNKSSTFIWSTALSPLALGQDERKSAAAYGFLTSQTRLLNIKFTNDEDKNFIVFHDPGSRSTFLENKIRNSGISRKEAEKFSQMIAQMSPCETMVFPDDAGRIQSVFVTNFYPYGTADFSGCLQMMGLRAFGAYLKNDHFPENPDADPASAFDFLIDTYRTADREQPFESISPR